MGGAQERGAPAGAYARRQASMAEPAAGVLQQGGSGGQADEGAGLRAWDRGQQGSAAREGEQQLDRGDAHGEPENPGGCGGQPVQGDETLESGARLEWLERRNAHQKLT